MKKRLTNLVLFLSLCMSQFVEAETWTPGTPKPICSPETWIGQLAGFFGDVWTYLTY